MEQVTTTLALKQKIAKTIYYVAFFPYIIFGLLIVTCGIIGVPFIFDIIYGLDACIIAALAILLKFWWFYIACITYQIMFLIVTRKKPEYKMYNTKRFLKITGYVVIGILCLCFIVAGIKSSIST